ncbi:MAG: hypothetical protein M1450_04855 [Patescibacteria group bacterium]|nr:hypothetical protein [Patescibacteria group bacterium]
MRNLKQGIINLFSSLDNQKIFGAVAFLVIIAAIPLTIYLAQTQQEVRQRAQEKIYPPRGQTCPANSIPGFYCQTGGCDTGDIDLTKTYSCANGASCCYMRNPLMTKTPTPSVRPSVTLSITPSPSGSINPTETPAPTDETGQTLLDFEIKLMAVGQNKSQSENDDPKNKTRTVSVRLFKSSGSGPVISKTMDVDYDDSSGTFKGTLDLSEDIDKTQDFAIQIKTGKYLSKIAGIDDNRIVQRIVKGETKSIPLTMLIVGDINSDNMLNIEDWNIWNACHNKTMDTPVPLQGISGNCSITDLNDDGEVDSNRGAKINMKDYIWLFNSFQVQTGD